MALSNFLPIFFLGPLPLIIAAGVTVFRIMKRNRRVYRMKERLKSFRMRKKINLEGGLLPGNKLFFFFTLKC